MASIKFEVLSNSQTAPIYLRLSVKRNVTPRAKTGLYIDSKEVVTGSLDKMSMPELEAKLKELREGLIVNGEYEVIEDNTTTVEIESER